MDYIELNLLESARRIWRGISCSLSSPVSCVSKIKMWKILYSQKAIGFARQRLAMTYLVFSNEESPGFVGYFTLANKFVSINGNALSKTLQKRIEKFSQYDKELEPFSGIYAFDRATRQEF